MDVVCISRDSKGNLKYGIYFAAGDKGLCGFCGHCKKDKNVAYSAENGIAKLKEAAIILQDHDMLTLIEKNRVKYHTKSCYTNYIRKSKRVTVPVASSSELQVCAQSSHELDESDETDLSSPRTKRSRICRVEGVVVKKCIICNFGQHLTCTVVYRICTPSRAREFMNAYLLFGDAVFTRCSTYSSEGDIFAADIYYHSNCMSNYLKKYRKCVDTVLNQVECENAHIIRSKEHASAFDHLLASLDLTNNCYSLSYCREIMNDFYKANNIAAVVYNRTVKALLIDKFNFDSDMLCFTYPTSKGSSQMFFYLVNVIITSC